MRASCGSEAESSEMTAARTFMGAARSFVSYRARSASISARTDGASLLRGESSR